MSKHLDRTHFLSAIGLSLSLTVMPCSDMENKLPDFSIEKEKCANA